MSVPFGPVYPESAYRKIFQLVADSEKPALHEHLQWEIEYGERADEFECLGPRPRRGDLFLILGDLEDEGALVATPEGIEVPDVNPPNMDTVIGNLASRGLVVTSA